jgi:FtsZ-binding cell division protein ZapB
MPLTSEAAKTAAKSVLEDSTQSREGAYLDGSRAAWEQVLGLAIQRLGGDPEAGASLLAERTAAVAALRSLCEDMGASNDWPPTLHLADVIDKHLGRHLHASNGASHNASLQAQRDELKEANARADASRESHAALQKFLRTLRDKMVAEADSLWKESKRDRARALREYIGHIESVLPEFCRVSRDGVPVTHAELLAQANAYTATLKELETLHSRLRNIVRKMRNHAASVDGGRRPSSHTAANWLRDWATQVEASGEDRRYQHPPEGYAAGDKAPPASEVNRLIDTEDTLSAQVASLQHQRDELKAENRRLVVRGVSG